MPNSAYPIRVYQAADEDAVIRVWLASTIAGQSFLPENHWREMEPDIRALLATAEVWVIDGEEEIIAFVSLLDDLIGGLFTHPDHQSSGLGAAMVAHARTLHDPLFVEVFEANERALKFYRRCGFEEHETHIDKGSGLSQLILKMGS